MKPTDEARALDPYAPPLSATPQAVQLHDLPQLAALASPGQRLLGALVSHGSGLLVLVPVFVGAFVQERGTELSSAQNTAMLVASGVIGLFVTAAHAVLAMRSGQTLGKRIVGTQIVDQNGHPATFGAIVVRSVIESFLWSLLSCLASFDGLMVFSKDRRTLHDRIAGTWVVDLAQMEQVRAAEGIGPRRSAPSKVALPAVALSRAGIGRRMGAGMVSWTVAFGVLPAPAFVALAVEDDITPMVLILCLLLVTAWGLGNLYSIGRVGTSVVRHAFGMSVVDAQGRPAKASAEHTRVLLEYGSTYLLMTLCMGPAAWLGYLPLLRGQRGFFEQLAGTWVVHADTLAQQLELASADSSVP